MPTTAPAWNSAWQTPAQAGSQALVADPVAPTTASLLPWKTSATTWANLLYGPAIWNEGGVKQQWCDVYLPVSAAPVGGYPVVCWFHPNGSDKTFVDSDLIAARDALLAAGFAVMSFEFRHPVVNVALGAPHTDCGLAIQFARSLAVALNLDESRFFGQTQSRGTLALWQTLQADMANPNALTWAGRRSSKLKAIWSYQGQSTYSTTQMANLMIVSGERALFVATYPDDPRWGSAITSAATAGVLPDLYMRHRDPYNVGLITVAQFDEHEPSFGTEMGVAYTAAGQGSKFTGLDNVTGANAWTGMVAWFTARL